MDSLVDICIPLTILAVALQASIFFVNCISQIFLFQLINNQFRRFFRGKFVKIFQKISKKNPRAQALC